MDPHSTLANINLTTRKGKPIVEFEDRLFRHDNKLGRINAAGDKLTYYYECCDTDCLRGRLTISYSINILTGEIIPNSEEYKHKEESHTCVPNQAEIFRKKAKLTVVNNVLSGKMGITQAQSNAVTLLRSTIGDNEASQFPNTLNIKRTVNRKVAALHGFPPSSFDDLQEIPKELGLTRSGEKFLLVFSKYNEPNGSDGGIIIVYSTKSDFIKLIAANVVAGDGTFNIKPRPYSKRRGAQVYTLGNFEGVKYSRRLYRRVFALLPRKTKACYQAFLRLTFEAAQREYDIDLSNKQSQIG